MMELEPKTWVPAHFFSEFRRLARLAPRFEPSQAGRLNSPRYTGGFGFWAVAPAVGIRRDFRRDECNACWVNRPRACAWGSD